MDQALAESPRPGTDRYASAETTPFERKEPRDGLPIGEDRDSNARPEPADGERELRG
jgi:hypothetical protein